MRSVTIQYAGEVFPPNHVTSRFILLVGAGDIKEEVANRARYTLDSLLFPVLCPYFPAYATYT